MKLGLVGLLFAPQILFAGLEPFGSLLRVDSQRVAPGSIRVTYLGVNGYQLEAGDQALLVDPYFTRAGLSGIAFEGPLEPDPALVDRGLKYVRDRVGVILVTHGHFDHLLDAPLIMKKTGARLFSGATAVKLAISAGAPGSRCSTLRPGSSITIGPWKIRAFTAAHDRLFGGVPYTASNSSPTSTPLRARDWIVGEPLAFLVEANGRRVYIDAGGRPELLPEPARRVDLAILGVALPDSRKRFAAAVTRLRPRFVLPSHQDNFFAPFAHGFTFGPLTDFGFVRRTHARQNLPGELILLDYFRPWTIP